MEKNWLKIAMIAALCLVLILGIILIVTHPTNNQKSLQSDSQNVQQTVVENQQLRQQAEEQKSSQEATDAELTRIQAELTAAQAEKDTVMEENLKLANALFALQDDLSSIQDQARSLQAENDKLTAQIASLQEGNPVGDGADLEKNADLENQLIDLKASLQAAQEAQAQAVSILPHFVNDRSLYPSVQAFVSVLPAVLHVELV